MDPELNPWRDTFKNPGTLFSIVFDSALERLYHRNCEISESKSLFFFLTYGGGNKKEALPHVTTVRHVKVHSNKYSNICIQVIVPFAPI